MIASKGFRVNDWKFENFIFGDRRAAEDFCRATGMAPEDADGAIVECIMVSSEPRKRSVADIEPSRPGHSRRFAELRERMAAEEADDDGE